MGVPSKTPIILALLSFAAFGLPPAISDSCENGPYLFGASLDCNERRGYYAFPDGPVEAVNRNDLWTWGILLGYRFRLTPGMRLQVTGTGRFGAVDDDTLQPDLLLPIGGPTLHQRTLLNGGIITDLQFPIQLSPGAWFFYHAGGGLHLARIWDMTATLSDISLPGDPAIEPPHTMVSASIHAGVGIEFIVTRQFGMALSYSLRYWDPVHYLATGGRFSFPP